MTEELIRPAVVMYMPVIHQGYLKYIVSHPAVSDVLLIGSELASNVPSVRKDLRALDARWAAKVLNAYSDVFGDDTLPYFSVADEMNLRIINGNGVPIFMPDEDVCRYVAAKYLPHSSVKYENIHLRWNKSNLHTLSHVRSDANPMIREELAAVVGLVDLSPDWWRQVAAICFKGPDVLLRTYNRHMPTNNEQMFVGDPRGSSLKGQDIELSLALHAEAGIVSEAAKRGIVLEGSSLIVTTFPCPVCARLIANCGIVEVYYLEPYTMLDAEHILTSAGVKLIPLIEKPLPA